ncbi:MAG TPA: sugar phosphate isomerase/epimerase [Firmicutes bacterium]|nr:sugar phosphate isomerase/epimerase [Bacillota bacterium]
MKKFNVALQLYSVRGDLEKDMEGTLRAVRAMGYDYVEFAGYAGRTAEEVRALLEETGLRCISVHQGYGVFLEEGGEREVDFLKTIGASFCAVPWMGDGHKGSAAFEKTLADFTRVSGMLKKAGIQLLYHNHDFEFEKVDGKYKLDWLYESLPADVLQTEIDTCWVRYAGVDPCAYLRQYAGRAPVVHLKDFTCSRMNAGAAYALIDDKGNAGEAETAGNDFCFQPLGMGVQDIPAILAAAEDAGADTVVVEQDDSVGRPPLEAARLSREYLKSLGL